MINIDNKYKPYILLFSTIILFLLNCSLLFEVHKNVQFWDNAVYINNAKYLSDNGNYFEPLRPPLLSIIEIPFVNIDYSYSILLVIIITLLITFFAAYKVSKLFEIDLLLTSFILLNPLIIISGLISGPEFMYTSLMMLFVISIYESSYLSGIYLGLAILLRYNAIGYIPLIFIDFKKSVRALLLLIIIILPWLIYNKIREGNFFYSIIDSYVHNELFHPNIAISLYDIIMIIMPIIIALIGYIIIRKEPSKLEEYMKKYKTLLIVSFLIYLVTIIQYIGFANKKFRFLLASLVFSYILLIIIIKHLKDYNKTLYYIAYLLIGVLSVTGTIVYYNMQNVFTDFNYKNFETVYNEYKLSPNCTYLTNYLPMLGLYGLDGKYFNSEKIDQYIDMNYNFLIFWQSKEKDTIDKLKSAPGRFRNDIYGVAYYENSRCKYENNNVNNGYQSATESVCKKYNICLKPCDYLDYNSSFKYKSYICEIIN